MISETEAILNAHLTQAEEDRDRFSRALDLTSRQLLAISLERNALRETLKAINERLDWIERDRHEPDKTLMNVASIRGFLIRVAPREEEAR